MPPDIVDIVIKAVGDWIGGISSSIDIVIKAVGDWIGGISSSIDIVIKATPYYGLGFLGFTASGFFLLISWWFFESHER